MFDLPVLIVAITMSLYWAIVLIMARIKRQRDERRIGIVPAVPIERVMWFVWVPVITLWIALPWFALRKDDPGLALPAFALDQPLQTVRWICVAVLLVAFGLTLWCWRYMGRSWQVAVVPDSTVDLVTDGPFRFARHPIYALSILLMLCSAVILPSVPMLICAALHVGLMHMKARIEEGDLHQRYGAAYAAYCGQTGRFRPRIARR